jgi:hypothetical protein
MQGKNVVTTMLLAVLLLICGLAGAKAWAEASQSSAPAQPVGPALVATTPSQAAATSSQGAATGSSEGTSEGSEGSDSATTSGQQAAEPEDGGSDSGGDG